MVGEMTRRQGQLEEDETPSTVEDLWVLMQEQRKQIERLEAELSRQRAEKTTLASRLETLEGGKTERRLSRAGLLKAAVAGLAAVAGAEAAGTIGAPEAAADTPTQGEAYVAVPGLNTKTMKEPAFKANLDSLSSPAYFNVLYGQATDTGAVIQAPAGRSLFASGGLGAYFTLANSPISYTGFTSVPDYGGALNADGGSSFAGVFRGDSGGILASTAVITDTRSFKPPVRAALNAFAPTSDAGAYCQGGYWGDISSGQNNGSVNLQGPAGTDWSSVINDLKKNPNTQSAGYFHAVGPGNAIYAVSGASSPTTSTLTGYGTISAVNLASNLWGGNFIGSAGASGEGQFWGFYGFGGESGLVGQGSGTGSVPLFLVPDTRTGSPPPKSSGLTAQTALRIPSQIEGGVRTLAPAGRQYSVGMIYVDAAGTIYHCVVAGNPGTWVPLISLVPFPSPHRVFSSPMTAGQTSGPIDVTVAGVPAGARSAWCAVQSSGAGVLTLYPDGAPDPGIANWSGGATNALNLLYMQVPLSAAGQFRIHAYFTGQIYVDVWGYLF